MAPQRHGQDVYFSVTEAARILGVSRQAVYAAINSGRLYATELGYGKKISASNLAVYGIQAGKSAGARYAAGKYYRHQGAGAAGGSRPVQQPAQERNGRTRQLLNDAQPLRACPAQRAAANHRTIRKEKRG